jgi:hypothetical protein
MRKIERYMYCENCADEGLPQKLGIELENGCLTVGCQNHDAVLQEFKLKQPVRVECNEPVGCTKCARKVQLDVGFTGDGKRIVLACKDHGVEIGVFTLAKPITLPPCPYCAEDAVGSHTH